MPPRMPSCISSYAYEPTYKGGVQVTTADMNGDGTPDIITAPNAGRVAEVRIFDGTNGSLARQLPAQRRRL